ncbi:hypothetical protein [Deinococcus aluminii]|uniref:Exo-alpha-sialidase n=1 Tax=Deinococcus aluminii TaxID=1656885 RepID=A0ABP9XCD4_9DEIO
MSRPLLLTLLLTTVLNPAVASGTGGVQTVSPPTLPGATPVRDLQLAADSRGQLTLAIITDTVEASSGRGTFMARAVSAWRWAAGTWTPMGGILNYDQPRPAANLNLALDAGGTPILAWNENYGDNDVVVFRAWQGGAWTDWKTRYLGISSPQAAKMRALAAWQGAPMLLWGENVREGVGTVLTLRRWQDGEWLRSPPLNEGPGYARQPALALNGQGEATAAWVKGPIEAGQVVVKQQSGGHWTPLGQPFSRHPQSYVASPRLALNKGGQPTVAWLEDRGGRDTLFASRWTGSRWEALGGAISTGFASAPSLALDQGGQPVIAWVEERGGVGQVHLARWTGRAWQTYGPVNLDPAHDARSPSVVVDASGAPVLAWREDLGGRYGLQLRRFAPLTAATSPF